MPTTFAVFSLGQLPVWDTVEGNSTVATGNVNLALQTYGSVEAPLFQSIVEFSPTGTGFSGGSSTSYDLDNTVSNDQFSIDGGAAQTFDASMTFNAVITYTNGTTASITAVVFQDVNGNTYWAPEITDNADQAAIEAFPVRSLELTSPIYSSGTFGQGYGLTANRVDSMPLCFAAGTLIECPDGARRIEEIRVGDLVKTCDHGPQRVRWIGRRELTIADFEADQRRRPVRCLAGSFGAGLPKRDLVVSRQHRILVSSKIANRIAGTPEVLIPAIKLTALPGIYVDEEAESVTYIHLLFDQHELLEAEGVLSESMFTGPEALKSVSEAARAEILDLFPELLDTDYAPQPARPFLSGSDQKNLMKRHAKHGRSIVMAS